MFYKWMVRELAQKRGMIGAALCCSVLQCIAVCCSVLQCVAVCCSVTHDGARTGTEAWHDRCCIVLCCSGLQWAAVLRELAQKCGMTGCAESLHSSTCAYLLNTLFLLGGGH